MIDRRIMHEVVDSLSGVINLPLQVCDTSGCVYVSTDPAAIRQMNLLAIEALNANAKVTQMSGADVSGAAIPITYHSSRIGALVVEVASALEQNTLEILRKSVELIYAEKIAAQTALTSNTEKDQFLFEWLQYRDDYNDRFIKRGKNLGIDITEEMTALLIENDPANTFTSIPVLQNIVGDNNYVLPAEAGDTLVILRREPHMEKKMNRVKTVCREYPIGISGQKKHLYTVYTDALRSLQLGKALFPNEKLFTYDRMKLAITLSEIADTELSDTFWQLTDKGQNAHLDETVIAYLQYNGDITAVCEALHIHRNSIQYRMKRIASLCGKHLDNYYDLLYLYASYIAYTIKT